jgi:hypothetical protein
VHVGILGYGTGVLSHPLKAFRESLAEFGYVEGQHLVIDQRYANGRREKLPSYLGELLALRVRALVVVGPYVLRIAKSAGTDTPIVAIDLESDPLTAGFVASLARPGGNVTGTFLDQASLSGKWLELLKEINPKLSRVAVIWDSSTPSYQLEAFTAGAKSIAAQQETLTITTQDDFKRAFATASRSCRCHGGAVLASRVELWRTVGEAFQRSSSSDDVDVSRKRGGRMSHGVWAKPGGRLASPWVIRRSAAEGRQARRPSYRAANHLRARRQPQNLHGTRPHDPAVSAGAGG